MGILFNSTALGIHFCETSLIFNFKTRLGGEICLCDVNMHKGYCGLNKKFLPIGGITVTIDILIKKNVMKMHVILEHHTFPMKVTYPW